MGSRRLVRVWPLEDMGVMAEDNSRVRSMGRVPRGATSSIVDFESFLDSIERGLGLPRSDVNPARGSGRTRRDVQGDREANVVAFMQSLLGEEEQGLPSPELQDTTGSEFRAKVSTPGSGFRSRIIHEMFREFQVERSLQDRLRRLPDV